MASSLCRRLILTSKLLLRNPNPNPVSLFHHHSRPLLKPLPFPTRHQNPNPIGLLKPFSSSYYSSQNPNPKEFQNQEIEGPTVERDDSALANETRQVIQSLRKSICNLSTSLALLGFAHLGLGAAIAYTSAKPVDEVSIQGVAAFAFPFSVAFLMRRSLKPLAFFQKMEEQGRFQVLTLSLQAAKSLNVLFLRVRVISFACVLGIAGGTLITVWLR